MQDIRAQVGLSMSRVRDLVAQKVRLGKVEKRSFMVRRGTRTQPVPHYREAD